MKPIHKVISLIALGSVLFFTANWIENSLSYSGGEFIKLGGVSFRASIDTGLSEAKALNKPIFVYFRSDTCYWCIRFEEEALSDKRVIDILNKNFVLISIDTFKQKKAALNLGVRTTPYMIFFTKEGEEISRIPGYRPTVEFLPKLIEVLQAAEANQTSQPG